MKEKLMSLLFVSGILGIKKKNLLNDLELKAIRYTLYMYVYFHA